MSPSLIVVEANLIIPFLIVQDTIGMIATIHLKDSSYIIYFPQ